MTNRKYAAISPTDLQDIEDLFAAKSFDFAKAYFHWDEEVGCWDVYQGMSGGSKVATFTIKTGSKWEEV